MNKLSLTIIYVSLLVISLSFIFNIVSATTPIPTYTEIHMKQDEVNKTLTVLNINYGGEGIVQFKGNASYPLPPLEIGDKITNCSGTIVEIYDGNYLVDEWEFQGDTNSSITSYSYTFINPNPESEKTPGFELIFVLVAVALVLFLQRK